MSPPTKGKHRKPRNIPILSDSDDGSAKHTKKRKKRVRGQKPKTLTVISAGDLPPNRRLKHGKVRHLDVLRKHDDSALPRSTREMLSMMAHLQGETLKSTSTDMNKSEKKVEQSSSNISINDKNNVNNKKSLSKKNDPVEKRKSLSARQRMTEGMREGESFPEFSARLRAETRQMLVKTRRQGTRKAEKRRAYYARRDERARQRRRRRQGIESSEESDAGEDGPDDGEMDGGENNEKKRGRRNGDVNVEEELDEHEQRLSALPMYWQEIVRNGGRPLSERKRRRMARMEQADEDRVRFGEQVDRPPQFESIPVRRGRASIGGQ